MTSFSKSLGVFYMSTKTKKFLSYYKPYKKLIVADLFCALVSSGISILIPLIISYITKNLIGESLPNNSESMKLILILIAVLAGLLVIEYFTQVFVTYMGHYTGTLVNALLFYFNTYTIH